MRYLLLSAALFLAVALAGAVENQAFLGVFAETSVQKIVGMPDMTEMLKDLPPGMALPGGMTMPGMPKRALTVRLWSPGIAPKTAFAKLAIPAGLKQGKQLDLELYRPEAVTGAGGGKGEAIDPGQIPQFTIKRYWGSSATVKRGQPDVTTFGGMSAAEQDAVRAEANKAQNPYFYKPDWTTGYWPTPKQPGAIAADAALKGTYALTTNYTGNVTIDVPDTVLFLNPIEFSSPKFDKKIDLTKAITFKWKTIPGVLGYHAHITGMIGQDTLITWSSSEVKRFDTFGFDYMQMADVIAMVQANVFMGPERTEVIVPAGIFKDCDFVSFMMIGYGTGAALGEGQPLPRVQTKTVVTAMLGGKKMQDMGGMGGGGFVMPDGDDEE